MTSPPAGRLAERDLEFSGSRRAVKTFLRAIEVFPFGRKGRLHLPE